MTVLFLIAVCFCLYTYIGFPILLHWRAGRADRLNSTLETNKQQDASGSYTRTVSIVIAAHNELERLPAKIASLDELSYPDSLLECIFVSDGSTDGTVEFLEEACRTRKNWHIESYVEAAGKPTAINTGVARATGEIIVFMDARQRVSSASVEALVARLEDPSIGAVSGALVLANDHGLEALQIGLYWRYEKWIRDNESRLFSTTGATGALYAIRRRDFEPLRADALLDDFDIPVSLLRKGKRTVLEPAARLYDQAEAKSVDEFRRKTRTLSGNFQSFSRHRWLFHPRRNPVWWQFISHKVFRLLVPYALGVALLASALGTGPFLRMMLAAQLIFYALGLLGWAGLSVRPANLIKIFLQLNAAAVVGAWRAARGRNSVRWKSS